MLLLEKISLGRMIRLLAPQHWKDYELLDCGNFEKLERFGEFVLIRPEPQAIWQRKLPQASWEKVAHARFVRTKKQNYHHDHEESGGWKIMKKLPESWSLNYRNGNLDLTMMITLTSFGHIGVFPEQACNWDYIYNATRNLRTKEKTVLNLFAYTGAASVAAKAAGADITHLDSVKQVVTWARENMVNSGVTDIRWVVEDALTFVKREVKRGKKYNGIIMDPPAYGRGPAGEKWILQEGLPEIMESAARLLPPDDGFFVLNLYSLGFSSLIGLNVANHFFPDDSKEYGEFYLHSKTGIDLPLGTFLRFMR